MFRSWRIGRIFGVPTELHWSFALVPAAILYYAYVPGVGVRWTQVQWWSAITALLFTFVLIHELGHALMAKNRGVKAEKIILFPLGGGALIPDEPKRTRDEILIYAAGPVANIVLALLALPVLLWQPGGEYLVRFYVNPLSNLLVSPTPVEQLLGITLGVNALLAVGNLLPAYPLDGGRILRALLKAPVGDRRATVITTLLGIVIGASLLVPSFTLTDPLLGVSALFIIGFSALELNRGWQRRHLAETATTEVLRELPTHRLYANDSVARGRTQFATSDAAVLPVYNSWNELSGFVEKEVLLKEATRDQPIAWYYEAEYIAADIDEPLLTLTERIVAADVYGAALYDRGRPVGFVYTEDVIRLLDRTPRRFYKRFTSRG